MATSTTNRKLGKLYEGLSERERVRMMAKLAREHKPDEMNRLRDATPPEHAETYNRALKLLRTLNGNVPDWITLTHIGIEREALRLTLAIRERARNWLERYRVTQVWKITPYPVTESEYRALATWQRTMPEPVDEWLGHVWETSPDTPGLRPELAEILRERPDYHDESDEAQEREDELWQRFYGCVIAAIERGELKTKPRPKDASGEDDGEPWVAAGALSDWALGTTANTYEPFGPDFSIPAIDQLFAGSLEAEWEILHDEQADKAKARREELRRVFLTLSGISQSEQERFPSFEPPLTLAQWRKANKQARTLREEWFQDKREAELAVAAATEYAGLRAQLEGLGDALAIIQRDDFADEDPLWPEVRASLEEAQAQAERFAELWKSSSMAYELHKAMGLDADILEKEPPPLPTVDPVTDEMLALIRSWGE